MTKEELLKQVLITREEKRKLAWQMDDAVIERLNATELAKLLKYNKRDVENFKKITSNEKELNNFVEGYKNLLSIA